MERVVKVNSEAEMLRIARSEYDGATDDQVKLHCLMAILMDEVSRSGDVEHFHKIMSVVAALAATDRVSFDTYLDSAKLAGAAFQAHERKCRKQHNGVKH